MLNLIINNSEILIHITLILGLIVLGLIVLYFFIYFNFYLLIKRDFINLHEVLQKLLAFPIIKKLLFLRKQSKQNKTLLNEYHQQLKFTFEIEQGIIKTTQNYLLKLDEKLLKFSINPFKLYKTWKLHQEILKVHYELKTIKNQIKVNLISNTNRLENISSSLFRLKIEFNELNQQFENQFYYLSANIAASNAKNFIYQQFHTWNQHFSKGFLAWQHLDETTAVDQLNYLQIRLSQLKKYLNLIYWYTTSCQRMLIHQIKQVDAFLITAPPLQMFFDNQKIKQIMNKQIDNLLHIAMKEQIDSVAEIQFQILHVINDYKHYAQTIKTEMNQYLFFKKHYRLLKQNIAQSLLVCDNLKQILSKKLVLHYTYSDLYLSGILPQFNQQFSKLSRYCQTLNQVRQRYQHEFVPSYFLTLLITTIKVYNQLWSQFIAKIDYSKIPELNHLIHAQILNAQLTVSHLHNYQYPLLINNYQPLAYSHQFGTNNLVSFHLITFQTQQILNLYQVELKYQEHLKQLCYMLRVIHFYLNRSQIYKNWYQLAIAAFEQNAINDAQYWLQKILLSEHVKISSDGNKAINFIPKNK